MNIPRQRYSELAESYGVRETPQLINLSPNPPEIEVQALWFSGLLGRSFTTTDGRKIEIVDFGRWNREAGPDFEDVVLRYEGGTLQKGSLEIDRELRDWEKHGHDRNAAFETVILHLFVRDSGKGQFFSRTLSNREVPQARLDLCGTDVFRSEFPVLAHSGRCMAPLAGLTRERTEDILYSAAFHRLKLKSDRLRHIIEARGEDNALFMLCAEGLGYRDNKLPMLLLAQRVLLNDLRAEASAAEALLFGVAGFLERERPAGDPPSQCLQHYRDLWEFWWGRRSRYAHLVLKPRHWHAGGRPQNHPQRRLAALSAIAVHWRAFKNRILRGNILGFESWLAALEHPFWSRHFTFTSAPSPQPLALVGAERARDLFANVVVPFRFAIRGEGWEDYSDVAGAALNSRLKTASIRLFGSLSTAKVFTKRLFQQQGLLQIYEDFCLKENSGCVNCSFPKLITNW